MDSREFFPSRWLKAEDVGEKTLRMEIRKVQGEEIGNDKKLVVYFNGEERGLALNSTNHQKISEAFGHETDNWISRELELYTALVTFKDREVKAIRVRAVLPGTAPPAPAK